MATQIDYDASTQAGRGTLRAYIGESWERGFAAGLEALADHLTGRRKYSNANVLAAALPTLASLPHC